MQDGDPFDKLALLILLSALKKRASAITLRADAKDFVVTFTIEGQRVEEMRPPVEMRARMFAKLGEMSGLTAGDGDGIIQLAIGEAGQATFSISLRATGPVALAELRPVVSAGYP